MNAFVSMECSFQYNTSGHMYLCVDVCDSVSQIYLRHT